MSAAPSAVPQPIRAVCKVPVSYFEKMLGIFNFAQLKCFGLVLDRSVGSSFTWAAIPMEEFVSVTNVTADWCSASVESLDRSKYIDVRYRNGKMSQPEYRVNPSLADEAKAKEFTGKCEACHATGVFITEFVPLPHTFFRKLPAGVNHATFCCVAVVSRYTLKWTAEKGIWSEWKELDKNDFERLADLDPRQITNGLREAVDLRLIERQDRPGKPSLYRACPENFGSIGQRAPRTVSKSEGEHPIKTKSVKSTKSPNNPHETHEIESAPHRYGLCRSCGHFGPVEDATIMDLPPKVVRKPPTMARAGPISQIFSSLPEFKPFKKA